MLKTFLAAPFFPKRQESRNINHTLSRNKAMSKIKQELIGSFMVVNERQEIKKIVVSQDIITHYSGGTSHSKNLYLDSIDGVKVYKTHDPDIFKLIDGTLLRRKGSLRSQSE